MNINKYIWIAAIAAACGSCDSKENKPDASGSFEAEEIIVSAEADGLILSFGADEGDMLEPDREIGCIDTIQLYLKKEQLQTSRNAVGGQEVDAGMQTAPISEQIKKAMAEKQRIENMVKDDAAPRKQLDDINSQIAVLQKQMQAQRQTISKGNSSVNQERSSCALQIRQIDDMLRRCHIHSPIRGVMLTKYVNAGECTAQGRPLFKVADISHMTLHCYTTSALLDKVAVGDKVTVTTNTGDPNEKHYTGVVKWISEKAEFTPKSILTPDERNNQVYAMKIDVDNKDRKIKIGMYGNVTFGDIK